MLMQMIYSQKVFAAHG